MKYRELIGVILGLSCACPLKVRAEFRCESKVGYTVELDSKTAAKPVATLPNPTGTVTAAAPPDSNESTIYLAIIDARAEDEAKTKAKLQKESGRHLERVREECRQRHENVGGCIASKFETNATILRNLGFSARKSLEDALRSDCEAHKGRCKKIEATDPVCTEIVVPVTETPAAEAGKDEKKKKK